MGDEVIIRGKIKSIAPNVDACNCEVTLSPMPPSTEHYVSWFNMKQVEKA